MLVPEGILKYIVQKLFSKNHFFKLPIILLLVFLTLKTLKNKQKNINVKHLQNLVNI